MDIFNTAEASKKIQKEQKKDYDRQINDIRRIIKSPDGRRFIWWILSQCHIFKISFNLNTKLEDFQEGERNIGLEVLNRLNEADIGAFAQLQNEYLSEKLSKEALKKAEKKKEEDNG